MCFFIALTILTVYLIGRKFDKMAVRKLKQRLEELENETKEFQNKMLEKTNEFEKKMLEEMKKTNEFENKMLRERKKAEDLERQLKELTSDNAEVRAYNYTDFE